MRNLDEILKDPRIGRIAREVNNDKAIQIKAEVMTKECDTPAVVKFTRAMGWEHLSISFWNRTPAWDTMQEMKELFWRDDEVCFQLHPSKDNYINNCEHCLHIWRQVDKNIETPPTILVGFREGHEEEDKEMLKKMQAELGNPISDRDIALLQLNSQIAQGIKSVAEIKKLFGTN